MDLTINYYDQVYPNVGDIVFITMGEPDQGMVPCKIVEYPNCNGIIQTSHLTKRKRVKSIRSFLSQTKPVPAEVIDSDQKMVSLSIKFITKSDRKEYEKDFLERKKLLNIIKTISINSKIDFNYLIKKIIYPLNKILPSINKLEFLEENYQSLDYENLFGKVASIFKEKLFSFFKSKPKKFTKEFSVISSQSINQTKTMFSHLKKKQPKFIPKLVTTPTFQIEITDIENKANESIEKFLKDLTETCQEYSVNLKIN